MLAISDADPSLLSSNPGKTAMAGEEADSGSPLW